MKFLKTRSHRSAVVQSRRREKRQSARRPSYELDNNYNVSSVDIRTQNLLVAAFTDLNIKSLYSRAECMRRANCLSTLLKSKNFIL